MEESKKLILIVDDDPDVWLFITTVLEDHGYRTMEAEDEEQALARLGEARPDLITLDVNMPQRSGVRLYRELRSSEPYRQIPVIMVTGMASEFQQFISSRRQIPAPEGYLAKPVDEGAILGTVQRLL